MTGVQTCALPISPAIITGIVSAAIICATMSSADSNLLCMSTMIINDIYPGFGGKKKLNDKQTPVVFLLWGAHARKKAEIIDNPIHYKLACAHPSPLSAYNGFFGCRHFSKTNELLRASGQKEISWELE